MSEYDKALEYYEKYNKFWIPILTYQDPDISSCYLKIANIKKLHGKFN